MSVRLTPCPACARHVKLGDCSCPFCGAKVACVGPRAVTAGERMSRSALFAAGALGTVLGATDCSSATPVYGAFLPPTEAGSDAAQSDAPSTPPDESGAPSDAAAPSDGRDESPGVVALYGGFVPIDASKDDG